MKLADVAESMGSLLEAPSPATLTLYRADGTALVSPVWFRLHDQEFEIVVARDDLKVDLLRNDPRAILLIFETVPPFRGVRVAGAATLTPDDRAAARRAIASRYLGPEPGRAYADLERRPPGFVRAMAERHRHGLGPGRQAALTRYQPARPHSSQRETVDRSGRRDRIRGQHRDLPAAPSDRVDHFGVGR